MTRKILVPTLLLLCVSARVALCAATGGELIPAGTLLQCTLDEPNFSSKTAEIGDPVLCHLGHLAAFGHSMFPRGAELGGHLQDYKNPGHFVGKGWMEIDFDRIILPGAQVFPIAAKVVSAPHLKADAAGDIRGGGHAKRDAALWAVPIFWPEKLLTLPLRGPYPALKGESRLTLRLLEDVEVPLSSAAMRSAVPMPPWATQGRYDTSPALYRPASTAPREPVAALQSADLIEPSPLSTVIVRKGGSAYLARQYWLEAGSLHCLGPDGESTLIALESVDLSQTVQINAERHVEFVVRSKQPIEQ
jgi:hypothetical protein